MLRDKELSSAFNTIITYLDMRVPPTLKLRWPAGEQDLELSIVTRPELSTYRDIYNHVGRPHHWVNRRYLSDQDLMNFIHHDAVHILFLKRKGNIIGFSEVNTKKLPQIELAFLGLIPEEKHKGLGSALLHHTLDFIWQHTPKRVIIETNTLDDPQALKLYQKVGFLPYKRNHIVLYDKG